MLKALLWFFQIWDLTDIPARIMWWGAVAIGSFFIVVVIQCIRLFCRFR